MELHLPAADVVSARDVFAQHVSIAHVAGDVQGEPLQVHVLPGPVPQVHAAEAPSPGSQLPSEVSWVQVASPLAADHAAAVTVGYGGGVPGLQAGAGLAQSP